MSRLWAAVPVAVRLGIEEGRAHSMLRAELERLLERSVIRAAYALPGAVVTAAPSTAVPTIRAFPEPEVCPAGHTCSSASDNRCP